MTTAENRKVKPGKRIEILWTVPRIWLGAECFILGGGPSLKAEHVARLQGRRVIAVNNAYLLAPWADVLFFGDCRWYDIAPNGGQPHKARLTNFGGLIVTTCEGHRNKPGIKVIKRKNSPKGIYKQPYFLGWNSNSGACAINLAVHFGAKRIVLMGFDMRKIDGHGNWHEDHPNSKNPKHQPYSRFLLAFPQIAVDLKRMQIECVNATPGSALKEFPIITPEEAIGAD